MKNFLRVDLLIKARLYLAEMERADRERQILRKVCRDRAIQHVETEIKIHKRKWSPEKIEHEIEIQTRVEKASEYRYNDAVSDVQWFSNLVQTYAALAAVTEDEE